MPVKIGIDAGGTMLKMVYEENGRLHFKTYTMEELGSFASWMKLTSPIASIALTGRKSEMLKRDFFPHAPIVSEFEANCNGACFMMKETGASKDNYLLINIGTGTSIYLIRGGNYSRVSGSGIGGGTFMGLGKLMTGENQFSELVSLAGKGDHKAADLLVKDIYYPAEPPLDGSLTASNFGKAVLNKDVSNEDKMASLTNMIAETIALLSMHTAVIHQLKDVAYIGGTLKNNRLLKERLKHYTDMLGLKPLFVENGEYSGAVGAFLTL
ncbi:type II pantothenate kinase [Bacillus sp. J33]|uniref:type II pantothenate kinase n=1 Tax=Bacillus sp. J33 TaxID=935836 RepID=UPI0004B97431|nr:type II pantothenate kinase [Bacillus sp. J33]